MKSIWITTYAGNEIRIENSWFGGEKLYVNNKLQDRQINFFTASLTGHLFDKNEKKPIKAHIFSEYLSIKCNLFVDDNLVELKQIK